MSAYSANHPLNGLVVVRDPGAHADSQAAAPAAPAAGADREERRPAAQPADAVSDPARLTRIAVMLEHLLEEARNVNLDGAGRRRLREIHQRAVREVSGSVGDPLRDELQALRFPMDGDTAPTDGELRVAQAQLLGWLDGLFRGINTALSIDHAAPGSVPGQREAAPGAAHPPGHGQPPPGPGTLPTGHYL